MKSWVAGNAGKLLCARARWEVLRKTACAIAMLRAHSAGACGQSTVSCWTGLTTREPRVIGITRHEASVPAPSLAAERIHINALRAYGSYRFHGLAFELGFKCYKMRWMRWGQWCGYESSDSDSESDGAMPPLEQQEADPVDLPDLA